MKSILFALTVMIGLTGCAGLQDSARSQATPANSIDWSKVPAAISVEDAAKAQAEAEKKQAAAQYRADEPKRIAAAKLAAKKQAAQEAVWKREEAEDAKEEAAQAKAFWHAVNEGKAKSAAATKAHADAIEAAKIERRDHPEIGRKRDIANAKARLAQIQAEEDVYAATHNGRTKDQDTMKNLEQMSDTLQRQQRGGF